VNVDEDREPIGGSGKRSRYSCRGRRSMVCPSVRTLALSGTSNGCKALRERGHRFNRRYVLDPVADADTLVETVRLARSLGYRRIVLTGQSTGAWTSIIAASRSGQLRRPLLHREGPRR